jgi:EmrB/QacA subfamily drug resistance transporter
MVKEQSAGISKTSVVIIAAMSSFLTPFTSSSVNIALPSIDKELGLNAVALNWVATAYLLAAAIMLVPFGRVADIYGRKKIFQIGLIVDAAASVLCAVSPSGDWLIFFRALQGVGGAMIFGTGVAILTAVFPPNERGRVLGFNVAAVYAGLSVGPLIGGVLTGQFGWKSIFILNALLGFLILAISLWKLRGEWAGARGEKIDFPGAVFYSLSLVALMYGFSNLPDTLGIGLIVIGAVGLFFFLRWELRVRYPILNISLFKGNPGFGLSNLAALINYSAVFSSSFLLSLYLQYIKGFTPEHAGLVLIAQPVMQTLISPFAGMLSDRIESRVVASIGMALTTLGLILLIFLVSDTSLTFILISLIILGIGFALFSSPNVNAIMSSVDKKYYGVASGMLGTMRLIGQTLSLGIVLLLFSLLIGKVQLSPEYYPLFMKCLKIAFIISAALCFGGIFASIARGKIHTI